MGGFGRLRDVMVNTSAKFNDEMISPQCAFWMCLAGQQTKEPHDQNDDISGWLSEEKVSLWMLDHCSSLFCQTCSCTPAGPERSTTVSPTFCGRSARVLNR